MIFVYFTLGPFLLLKMLRKKKKKIFSQKRETSVILACSFRSSSMIVNAFFILQIHSHASVPLNRSNMESNMNDVTCYIPNNNRDMWMAASGRGSSIFFPSQKMIITRVNTKHLKSKRKPNFVSHFDWHSNKYAYGWTSNEQPLRTKITYILTLFSSILWD